MKNLSTSTFNFQKIIEENCLYVDKTEFLWKLIHDISGQYFLARPRRFGKSLTVSTLKAIFQGRKELFKGLAIYDLAYDWKDYPVIHFDFANCDAVSPDELNDYLLNQVKSIASEYGILLQDEKPSFAFAKLIEALSGKSQIVVLVDEYDKPILGNIANPRIKEMLQILRGFYSNLKKTEGQQRFCLLTGVSKFCHVSVFSDLNNLTDITMNPEYADMLGFTESEIRQYFGDRLEAIATKKQMTVDELIAKIKWWYNGYRFSVAERLVCNPVSISKFFYNGGEFSNFWFSTGTPSFLLELARKTHFNFEMALTQPVSELVFQAYEVENPDPMGLLWQTGYLTIRDVVTSRTGQIRYYLDFPDFEVKEAFNIQLFSSYSGKFSEKTTTMLDRLIEHILDRELDDFMKCLQAHFASIPYDIHLKYEKYYQSLFFQLFLLIGLYIEAEARTNDGRIDAYIKTAEDVFIFEFKLNKEPELAIAQISNKKYYQKFQDSGLAIHLIGVNFNVEKGQIDSWGEIS